MALSINNVTDSWHSKPIQRVCRYPLLFAELCKQIWVIDDAGSKAEVEKTYFRLRETAQEINKATNDRQAQTKIQRSWHLQDLLVFSQTVSALSLTWGAAKDISIVSSAVLTATARPCITLRRALRGIPIEVRCAWELHVLRVIQISSASCVSKTRHVCVRDCCNHQSE